MAIEGHERGCRPYLIELHGKKKEKGELGTRWDSVLEKVWKDIYRGDPRRGGVRREVWEVQGRSRRKDRKKGKG